MTEPNSELELKSIAQKAKGDFWIGYARMQIIVQLVDTSSSDENNRPILGESEEFIGSLTNYGAKMNLQRVNDSAAGQHSKSDRDKFGCIFALQIGVGARSQDCKKKLVVVCESGSIWIKKFWSYFFKSIFNWLTKISFAGQKYD